ncbi:MAG: LD-carboxypeptidase [Deltaproteobacteria bacterium]|nr:MAG: LD-carboxypeptidase [Deltaproteobacteria bacterium]
MSKLPKLQKGDIIDIIAPAGKPLGDTLKNAVRWVEEQGFVPRYHKDIVKGELFFAANEELQWRELKRALLAKDSKAVWCLRGGWGSMRFVPRLMKLKNPGVQKFFCGFSDITTLHLFLNQEWKWKTIHGSNLSAFGNKPSKSHQKEYLDLATGQTSELLYKGLRPVGNTHKKIIKGKLVGGNLCMLTSGLGTSLQPNLSGKILFLEEVGERGYRVDRMLEQMLQSGVLNKKVKAIVLGDFTEANEPNGKDLTMKAIQRLIARLDVPVFKGLKSGHGKINHPLVLNANVELDPVKGTLRFKF